MTGLPIDWEALAITDEVIASAEREISIFFLRRNLPYRPESMRVVQKGKWFLVQTKRPDRDRWDNERPSVNLIV